MIDEAAGKARAFVAEGGAWKPDKWLDLAEPASEALGGLGDLDLIASQFAWEEILKAASPEDYVKAACEELDDQGAAAFRKELQRDIARLFVDGWNKGAEVGHEVPADLQPVLESWHPSCPIPREEVEPRRLPPGRDGCWPVRNMVSPTDDRGNSARLLDHHGDEILFVGAAKGLGEHAFDGEKWIDGNAARELALQMCDDVIENLPVTEAMSYSVSVEADEDGSLGLAATGTSSLAGSRSSSRTPGRSTCSPTRHGSRSCG